MTVMPRSQEVPKPRRISTNYSNQVRAGALLWSERLILLAFAYLLWRPVSSGVVLYPMLALMSSAAVATVIRRRLTPPVWFVGAWLVLTAATALGAFAGSIHGNPGLNQQMTQWFGSLLVWGLFAMAMNPALARATISTLVWVSGACALMMLLFIAGQRGLPNLLPGFVASAQGAGSSGADAGAAASTSAGSGIRWYGLSTLTAAAPFLVAGLLMGPDRWMPRRSVTAFAAILTVLAALLAGRRAILLVVVLAPIIALLLRSSATPSSRAPRKISLTAVMSVLALPLLLWAAWESSVIVQIRGVLLAVLATFFGLGDTTELKADDVVRTEQTRAMLSAWADSPLWGQGLGAVVRGFSRSDERPWQFELQYHQLLLNEGLIGIIAVGLAVGLVGVAVRRTFRTSLEVQSSLVASATAAAALALANVSNPYLQAVGHGWGVALVAGVTLAAQSSSRPGQAKTRRRQRP